MQQAQWLLSAMQAHPGEDQGMGIGPVQHRWWNALATMRQQMQADCQLCSIHGAHPGLYQLRKLGEHARRQLMTPGCQHLEAVSKILQARYH